MEKAIKVISRRIVTANMGSCWCGDCYCNVFEDGSIEYEGRYLWQCSERIRKPVFPQVRRDYGSQLTQDEYENAMRSIKLERSEMIDGVDLLKARQSLELQLDVVNSRIKEIEAEVKKLTE